MSIRAWALDQLRAALLDVARLPDEPLWPRYMDDEYRRITAANCLATEYTDDSEAVAALCSYIMAGDNQEVRCRCLTLLEKLSPLDKLIDQLLDDPEPVIRLYSLEYMLSLSRLKW